MGVSKEIGAIAFLLEFEISLITYSSSLVFICKNFEKKKKILCDLKQLSRKGTVKNYVWRLPFLKCFHLQYLFLLFNIHVFKNDLEWEIQGSKQFCSLKNYSFMIKNREEYLNCSFEQKKNYFSFLSCHILKIFMLSYSLCW